MSSARFFTILGCAGFLAAAPLQSAPASAAGDFARQLNDAFTSVFEKVVPTVVVIQAEHQVAEEEQAALDNFDFFFRERERGDKDKRFKMPEPPQHSEASGFFIRTDGYILTNNHAIEDADKIEVRLKDGRRLPAKIVGRDDKTDIAVIKVEGKNFPAVEIADSDAVKVGQMVCAIGVPYNLDYSFTCGWVSAKGRSNLTNTVYEDYIQTDAFINPGNSGGPLLDLDGRVIGMNTLINGIARGLSFAIPSNMLKDISDQLIAKGRVSRSWLGLVIENVGDDPAIQDQTKDVERGAVVRRIQAGTPAFKSDLRPADVITQVDGVRVGSARDLQKEIVKKKVGQPVELIVSRAGKTEKMQVATAELPSDVTKLASNTAPKKKDAEKRDLLGLKLQDADAESGKNIGNKVVVGVLVTGVVPDSPAARAEVRAGDVITEIDHKPVSKTETAEELIGNHNPNRNILLFINRDGQKTFLVLKREK